MRWFAFAMILAGTTGCDPEHRKECEWYLMPDPAQIGKADEGFIPVCARNLVVNKEDCRLQTTEAFARKVYGKKFRYSEMTVKDFGLPRTIEKIKFCN